MKEANVYLINKMINQKAKEQGFTITKPVHTGTVVSIIRYNKKERRGAVYDIKSIRK